MSGPDRPSSEAKAPRRRVAVVLYGLLREFRVTAPSILRHVIDPNEADVFYFGPAQTDVPTTEHKGKFTTLGTMTHSPKSSVGEMVPADIQGLSDVYNDRLRRYELHDISQGEFARLGEEHCKPRERLFRLNPGRMYSMFYNMQGAARLLEEAESELGYRFTHVIITRPDLAFYSRIKVGAVRRGTIHIPDGEGFSDWGEKYLGNAPVFFYKNVNTGDYIPGGRQVRFNDQLFALSREDLSPFTNIYDNLSNYLDLRVPASPETIMYLHLVKRANLSYEMHPEWVYEIYRKGMPLVTNLTDTSEIMFTDRGHPASLDFRRSRPVASIFRDLKALARHWARRLLR